MHNTIRVAARILVLYISAYVWLTVAVDVLVFCAGLAGDEAAQLRRAIHYPRARSARRRAFRVRSYSGALCSTLL